MEAWTIRPRGGDTVELCVRTLGCRSNIPNPIAITKMTGKTTQPTTGITISIVRDGAELGEWPEDQVRDHFQKGQLMSSDLYWHEGMLDWQPLRNLVKPPLPTPSPTPEGFRSFSHSSPNNSTPPILPSPPKISGDPRETPQSPNNNLVLFDTRIPLWIEVFGYLVLLFALSMLSDVVSNFRADSNPSTAGMLGGTTAFMVRDGIILTIAICFFKRHARIVFLVGLVLLTLLHLS